MDKIELSQMVSELGFTGGQEHIVDRLAAIIDSESHASDQQILAAVADVFKSDYHTQVNRSFGEKILAMRNGNHHHRG